MKLLAPLLALALWLSIASAHAAERVVTLAPNLAELVCAAGACSQLVGVTRYSDYPVSVRSLPQVGDAFSLNAEAVLALHPTLVVVWDGGTPAATVAQLQRLKLPLLQVRTNRLDDIASAVTQIGTRLGTTPSASKAAAEFRARIVQLKRRYANAQRLRVFYQLDAEPIFTINGQSPISEALQVCGGDNVFAALPQLASALSREAVLAANPDVVLYGRQQAAGIEAFWRAWPQAKAVSGKHLYAIDADRLSRATPRMAEGIAEVCARLDDARGARP